MGPRRDQHRTRPGSRRRCDGARSETKGSAPAGSCRGRSHARVRAPARRLFSPQETEQRQQPPPGTGRNGPGRGSAPREFPARCKARARGPGLPTRPARDAAGPARPCSAGGRDAHPHGTRLGLARSLTPRGADASDTTLRWRRPRRGLWVKGGEAARRGIGRSAQREAGARPALAPIGPRARQSPEGAGQGGSAGQPSRCRRQPMSGGLRKPRPLIGRRGGRGGGTTREARSGVFLSVAARRQLRELHASPRLAAFLEVRVPRPPSAPGRVPTLPPPRPEAGPKAR